LTHATYTHIAKKLFAMKRHELRPAPADRKSVLASACGSKCASISMAVTKSENSDPAGLML